jgi:putative endonuclease
VGGEGGNEKLNLPPLLELMHYVYVIKSDKDEKLYIGYTKDLKKRIQDHNKGKNFSTAYRGKFSLIYYEAFNSQKDATEREKQLKKFKSSYGQLKKRIKRSLHES